MKSYNLSQINAIIKGEIIGDTNHNIESPEQIELASNNQITFIGSKKYEKLWEQSNASIAIVNEDISILPGENKAFIKVKNADLAMSQILELFAPPLPQFDEEIHPKSDHTSFCTNWKRMQNWRRSCNWTSCTNWRRRYFIPKRNRTRSLYGWSTYFHLVRRGH